MTEARLNHDLLFQVSVVAIGGSAIIIEGPTGAGKSSLALAMIDRGATLIGDDGVSLTNYGNTIRCAPPPNIAGQIEIRHVGIVEMPTTEASLALIISLVKDAPRTIEKPPTRDVLGVQISALDLPQNDSILPLRVEWGLRLYGHS